MWKFNFKRIISGHKDNHLNHSFITKDILFQGIFSNTFNHFFMYTLEEVLRIRDTIK